MNSGTNYLLKENCPARHRVKRTSPYFVKNQRKPETIDLTRLEKKIIITLYYTKKRLALYDRQCDKYLQVLYTVRWLQSNTLYSRVVIYKCTKCTGSSLKWPKVYI